MLYCPKCNSTYQEGTQRFCTNDGVRLVSGSSAVKTASSGTQGVFTNLLGRASSLADNDERIVPKPTILKNEVPFKNAETPTFQTSFSSKVFKNEDLHVKKEDSPARPPASVMPPPESLRPPVRMVKSNEIASGTAEIGDRRANPTGRLALSWDKPNVLLGQLIKGRYQVLEKVGQDDYGIVYRAEDKIVQNKQVMVRVLMDEKKDPFISKIFSEERVSLSHINHPNVAGVLDSGELLEQFPFVITENVDGSSLSEKLNKLEQFNPLRTARIIRQASYALSEVHQNGILHRSLRPSNIYLTVSEVGTEQVKVAEFVVANGAKRQNVENVKYLSPEQLEGKMPNFASDIYSLAIIAYQMLTGRMPFNHTSVDQLLREERDGLKILPSSLRVDMSSNVDEVLHRALSFTPAHRFPKARDFGDALYNALNVLPTAQITENPYLQNVEQPIKGDSIRISAANENTPDKIFIENKKAEIVSPQANSILISSAKEEKALAESNKVKIAAGKDDRVGYETGNDNLIGNETDELAWEKRSPEPIRVGSYSFFVGLLLGLAALAAITWGIWHYISPKGNSEYDVTNQAQQMPPVDQSNLDTGADTAPVARQVLQPTDTLFFQNSKSETRGDLLKNYRGFSLYYPNGWTVNKPNPKTNFFDISKNLSNQGNQGFLEKVVVTYYNGTGLYSSDKDLFPKLVEKSNADLDKGLRNYQVLGEGESSIQDGRWKVHEVKFQGVLDTKDGKPVTIWGRRFWLPTQVATLKNGFVITILASSLSPEISSADELGTKGDLATILNTIEPSIVD